MVVSLRTLARRLAPATGVVVFVAALVVTAAPAFAERLSVEQATQFALVTPAPTDPVVDPNGDRSWRTAVATEGPNPLDDYGRVVGPLELARGLGKFGSFESSSRVQFNRTGDAGGASGLLFASASATAVPEPAAMLLLGLGGLAYAVRRRRTR